MIPRVSFGEIYRLCGLRSDVSKALSSIRDTAKQQDPQVPIKIHMTGETSVPQPCVNDATAELLYIFGHAGIGDDPMDSPREDTMVDYLILTGRDAQKEPITCSFNLLG